MSDAYSILHIGTRARNTPQGWEGAITLPTQCGIITVRGQLTHEALRRLIDGAQSGEEISGLLDGLLGGILGGGSGGGGGLLGGLLGGGGSGGGGGGGGGGLGGLLGGLLGGGGSGGGGAGGGGLGSLLGMAADAFIPGAGSIVGPLAGNLLGGILGGGGGGGGGLGGLLSGLLGGGAPPAAQQAAPALLGGATTLGAANQAVTSAPQLFGTLAAPISDLMRTGLRTMDQQASAAMGDPAARDAIARARNSAEARVANALRVAEGILAQHAQ